MVLRFGGTPLVRGSTGGCDNTEGGNDATAVNDTGPGDGFTSHNGKAEVGNKASDKALTDNGADAGDGAQVASVPSPILVQVGTKILMVPSPGRPPGPRCVEVSQGGAQGPYHRTNIK